MHLSSYADVFAIVHHEHADDIHPGDVVRTGDNHYPHFEVIAVSGDKAWVRNVSDGSDHLTARRRCRKVAQLSETRLAAE